MLHQLTSRRLTPYKASVMAFCMSAAEEERIELEQTAHHPRRYVFDNVSLNQLAKRSVLLLYVC